MGILHAKYYWDLKSLSGTKSTSNTTMCRVLHNKTRSELSDIHWYARSHLGLGKFFAAAAEKYGASSFNK